ncbi:MAG: dihydropteroate synthase family protein [Bacteroidaceae bacterium]|nr:dihydropteroate synthase family protein [Bacteroidaceae bacterium]
MINPIPYTLNIRGQLFDLSQPQVMGILNVTPDSFYASSRKQTEADIRQRVEEIVSEGGTMIDLGGYSTRPGANDVSPQEEIRRLTLGMKIIRETAPDTPVSIDTFRADVAKMAIEELGADIINDISGGQLDPQMFQTASKLGVPYVLTYNKPDPAQTLSPTDPSPIMGRGAIRTASIPIMGEGWGGGLICWLGRAIQQLRDLGQKDIILDPGYGFAKTVEQNYELLSHQEELSIFQLPLLVGISRKSMIYRPLDITPEESMNGTTVLNTIALMKHASILRVHDVKACCEVVRLCSLCTMHNA